MVLLQPRERYFRGFPLTGYYTFAAASLPLTELSADEKQRLPRYALLPAGLIGRLAVDQKYQGQRLGGALIMDAAARAARAEPAIFALIVDAKDDLAVTFYQRYEFRRFASKPASLFLPIATALQALSARQPAIAPAASNATKQLLTRRLTSCVTSSRK
jgi:GNAT superfamily N-acetyltransferase